MLCNFVYLKGNNRGIMMQKASFTKFTDLLCIKYWHTVLSYVTTRFHVIFKLRTNKQPNSYHHSFDSQNSLCKWSISKFS